MPGLNPAPSPGIQRRAVTQCPARAVTRQDPCATPRPARSYRRPHSWPSPMRALAAAPRQAQLGGTADGANTEERRQGRRPKPQSEP